MNKTLIAIVSAAFAVTTMFASSAEAGFKGGKFAVGFAVGALLAHQHYEHQHWKKKHIYVQRRTEKVYVSKKATKKSDRRRQGRDPTPAVDYG